MRHFPALSMLTVVICACSVLNEPKESSACSGDEQPDLEVSRVEINSPDQGSLTVGTWNWLDIWVENEGDTTAEDVEGYIANSDDNEPYAFGDIDPGDEVLAISASFTVFIPADTSPGTSFDFDFVMRDAAGCQWEDDFELVAD